MYLHKSATEMAEHAQLPEAGVVACSQGQATASWCSPSIAPESSPISTDLVIARFRAALESVQKAELERLYGRLPGLDDGSRHAIQQFSDSLVAQVLHPPLASLRDNSSAGGRQPLIDGLRRLFRLGD